MFLYYDGMIQHLLVDQQGAKQKLWQATLCTHGNIMLPSLLLNIYTVQLSSLSGNRGRQKSIQTLLTVVHDTRSDSL
jgi:hypothetical protein